MGRDLAYRVTVIVIGVCLLAVPPPCSVAMPADRGRENARDTAGQKTAGDGAPAPRNTNSAGGDATGPVSTDAKSQTASKEHTKTNDLLDLEIEQLRKTPIAPELETVVSTVTRQPSTVGRSPAAVKVITPEMIRRSGAQTIAEALRMVPGLHVARINSSKWAVSSRGFNTRFANKLLVLVDGRTVYNPLFAGTYWDVQDVVLEDIERIEVIRGPGATVWGANAVNGVINIITKNAVDTTGVYARTGGGTEERGLGTVRIGAGHDEVAWRTYYKWFDRDASVGVDGPAFDHWRQKRGGFRADWSPTCMDTLTMQGDAYVGDNGETFFDYRPEETVTEGHNILSRWTREIDEETGYSLLTYYDMADRFDKRSLSQRIEMFDVDFQHHFAWNCRNNVVWGVRYRRVKDFLEPVDPTVFQMVTAGSVKSLYSMFLQDEVTLREDELYFTVGTKLEKNDFTGFEIQPSARLLYLLDERRALWGAVSRAVRTPSRFDEGTVSFTAVPLEFQDEEFRTEAILGPSFGFGSEELIAYELGYRAQPSPRFSWDLAVFYNVYEQLRSRQLAGPLEPFPEVIALTLANDGAGHTYGTEVSAKLEVTPCWRLSAWYSFLRIALDKSPDIAQGIDDEEVVEGSSPRNQAFLMSSWDLGEELEFDLISRYVDSLPAQSVAAYLSLDARCGWQASRNVDVSVVGQNLLDSGHVEFGKRTGRPLPISLIQRGVFGYVTWKR